MKIAARHLRAPIDPLPSNICPFFQMVSGFVWRSSAALFLLHVAAFNMMPPPVCPPECICLSQTQVGKLTIDTVAVVTPEIPLKFHAVLKQWFSASLSFLFLCTLCSRPPRMLEFVFVYFVSWLLNCLFRKKGFVLSGKHRLSRRTLFIFNASYVALSFYTFFMIRHESQVKKAFRSLFYLFPLIII